MKLIKTIGIVVLFFLVFLLTSLFHSNAHADPISRYMQREGQTQYWADYIYNRQSGRHHISEKTAYRIAHAVIVSSSNYRVPVPLIVAVMSIESGFDPDARSHSGALGLMQVVPYWHRQQIAGRSLFNIDTAVDVGAQVLRRYLDKGNQQVAQALRYYCGYRGHAAMHYVASVTYRQRDAIFQQQQIQVALAQPRHNGGEFIEAADIQTRQPTVHAIRSGSFIQVAYLQPQQSDETAVNQTSYENSPSMNDGDYVVQFNQSEIDGPTIASDSNRVNPDIQTAILIQRKVLSLETTIQEQTQQASPANVITASGDIPVTTGFGNPLTTSGPPTVFKTLSPTWA